MEENNSEPVEGSTGPDKPEEGQVAPVPSLNNGKRADRVLAKQKRKEFLGKQPDFETLLKGGLLKIGKDGKLKLAPATDPKWASVSDKAEDAPTTNEPTPAPVGMPPAPEMGGDK